MIDARLGSLEDVELRGFLWKDNDLILYVCGRDYSSLVCSWAYGLIAHMSWESESEKKSGSLLSVRGTVDELADGEIELSIDFGSSGSLLVRCNEILVVE